MSITEEQRALRDLARDLFAKECSVEWLRGRWETGEADDRLWRTMAEAGLVDLAGHDLAIVLEEAGYAGVPEPLVETAVTGGGDLVALRLTGTPYVLDADRAARLVVEQEGELRAHERFTWQRVVGEDRGRRLFTVQPEGPGSTLQAAPGAVRTAVVAGTAALLCGVGRRLLDASVEHARTREQFGRPVGSFQAVQHKLASVHVLVEQARAAAWHAAGGDDPTAASVAKALAGDAARLASTEALQCHAGIGFTWEHDLHLWLKRAHALEAAYGTTREHRAALAAALLEGEPR